MSHIPREELAGILFQEIEGYLPKIEHGLSALQDSSDNLETLSEVHRFFHNIKGAASQVSFSGLSNAAALCEALIDDLLETSTDPDLHKLAFLHSVNERFTKFCALPVKTTADDKKLFTNTLSCFQSMIDKCSPEGPIPLPPHMQDWVTAGNETELHQIPPDFSANSHQKDGDALFSLRSVIPLLQELAGISENRDILLNKVIPPMMRAVKTLAECAFAAKCSGLHSLLGNFLFVLERLADHPELIEQTTPAFLQESLSYFDLVLSLPPDEGELAVTRIQPHLQSLCSCFVADLPGNHDSGVDAVAVDDFLAGDDVAAPHEVGFAAVDEKESAAANVFGFNEAEKESQATDRCECLTDIAPARGDTDNVAAEYGEERLELLEIFNEELEDHRLTIKQELAVLGQSDGTAERSSNYRASLSRVRRSVHTLKGAAAMAGFTAISSCAHALEDLLDRLHDNGRALGSTDLKIISDTIDAIEHLSREDNSARLNAEEISAALYAHLQTLRQNNSELDQPLPEAGVTQAVFDRRSCGIIDQPADAPYSSVIGEMDENDTSENPVAARDSDYRGNAAVMSEEERELLTILRAECEEHLHTINAALSRLDAKSSEPTPIDGEAREAIATMRRSIHTLKGAAAMTGFNLLSACAHSLEDLLDWLHDEATTINPDDLGLIIESVDFIEISALSSMQPDGAEVENLSMKIADHLNRRSAPGDSLDSLEANESVPQPSSSGTNDALIFRQPQHAETRTNVIAGDSGNIRVNLGDLNELVSIEGELVMVRGSIEKLVDKFHQSLDELNSIKDTLRRKTRELESGFEAQSLYGFSSNSLPSHAQATSSSTTDLSEFDPIELDRYSQLSLIIRALNEISIDVNAIYSEMSILGTNLQSQVAKQQLTMETMQEKLMHIRMTPLSSISGMLFRTVRQTADKVAKQVQLAITGTDVYMDRFIWAKTVDPIMHILRNCIDHGIEDQEVRERRNKPATGQITLDAHQSGRFVTLKISDDGNGIDTEKLRKKLIASGHIQADDNLDDQELLPYLFRPSVSTRDDISKISGRGVGLDIVLRNVQELRGTVNISNKPGEGVTFELSIPITFSVNRAVIIHLSDRLFAVPIQDITEVRRFTAREIVNGETCEVKWSGKQIQLVDLAAKLRLPPSESGLPCNGALALIVHEGEKHIAMRIDAVQEQREIIIKDLGSHLRYVKGINGVTLTGEGTIIPILNLMELSSSSFAPLKTVDATTAGSIAMEPLKVLVVDDSISVRYSITRLLEQQSWKSYQAVDGLDALEQLETISPDAIILDIEMPRMNGYEFMGMLRNQERYRNIPVIMLTSRASEKHRKKAEELEVDHYLTKPFHDENFIRLLSDLPRQPSIGNAPTHWQEKR